MGTALANRLCHYHVVCEAKQWIGWAKENDIAHEVLTFMEIKPDYLYGGQAASASDSSNESIIFPSPRKHNCGSI